MPPSRAEMQDAYNQIFLGHRIRDLLDSLHRRGPAIIGEQPLPFAHTLYKEHPEAFANPSRRQDPVECDKAGSVKPVKKDKLVSNDWEESFKARLRGKLAGPSSVERKAAAARSINEGGKDGKQSDVGTGGSARKSFDFEGAGQAGADSADGEAVLSKTTQDAPGHAYKPTAATGLCHEDKDVPISSNSSNKRPAPIVHAGEDKSKHEVDSAVAGTSFDERK